MANYDSKDLPPIVHYMQVIILGCIIEAQHRAQYQQHMSPDEARLQAMAKNTDPFPDHTSKEMIQESFRVAIRLWKAFDTLEIRALDDNRKVSADALIRAGL